jgi:prepilin peptidase CpaA
MSYLLSHWPLWFVCLALLVAAGVDGWKLKVPNWLTFPLILSGWALGLAHNFGLDESSGVRTAAEITGGGIGASLAGTGLGFALLFPLYAIGGMGAGDVKMQMGFGAWIGAFYGLSAPDDQPGALGIILWAFCLGAVIGGVLAFCMIIIRGQYWRNLSNARMIVYELFTLGNINAIATKAAERKRSDHLLPYGVPLCLGFISYLLYQHGG